MVFQSEISLERPTIQISKEGLRTILEQIETELLDSDIYRQTMTTLQSLTEETGESLNNLVKSIGREAIRLSFKQLAKQYKIVPVASAKGNPEDSSSSSQSQPNPIFPPETDSSVSTPNSLLSRPLGVTIPKKLTKAEQAQQMALQQRQNRLSEIGQTLKKARLDLGLSLQQLYNKTLVPMYQIQALEAGLSEKLPEDIYLRGFIQRLGNALELDGKALANSIPYQDPFVVPSWCRSTPKSNFSNFQLNQLHLYLGYTALVAGAAGGMAWMSHQATAEKPVGFEIDPQSNVLSTLQNVDSEMTTQEVKARTNIAPPEIMPD